MARCRAGQEKDSPNHQTKRMEQGGQARQRCPALRRRGRNLLVSVLFRLRGSLFRLGRPDQVIEGGLGRVNGVDDVLDCWTVCASSSDRMLMSRPRGVRTDEVRETGMCSPHGTCRRVHKQMHGRRDQVRLKQGRRAGCHQQRRRLRCINSGRRLIRPGSGQWQRAVRMGQKSSRRPVGG